MAISDKLNYLIETKQLFKDRLNSLGAEITSSTTFRNYLTWLDTFYGEVSNKTDISQNGVVGRTSQESTTGKNLLDNLQLTQPQTRNGITATPVFDSEGFLEYVNINGTATNTTTIAIASFVPEIDISYKVNGSPSNSTTSTAYVYVTGSIISYGGQDTSATWATTGSKSYQIIIQNGVTISNMKFYPMIRLATVTDSSYEPYTGNQPSPSPDYPQPINNLSGDVAYKISGKNKFDGVLELGNFNTNTGEKVPNSNYIINTNPIPVEELTNYKISLNGSGIRMYVFEYKEDLSYNLTTRKTVHDDEYLTTNSGTKYINFRTIDVNTNLQEKIQVEKGTASSEYEPYIEPQTFNIPLKSKNLFDGLTTKGSYNPTTGEVDTTIYAMWRNTNPIGVNPNNDYVFSLRGTALSVPIRIFYYDINKMFISTETTTNGKFITPADCYYVNWHSTGLYTNYPNGLTNAMIEKGSTTPTNYEPFYDIELCKIENYGDKIYSSDGGFYLYKETGKVVLNGSESIRLDSTKTITQVFAISNVLSRGVQDSLGICNYFISQAGDTEKFAYVVNAVNYDRLYIAINKTKANTVQEFKTWLSTHNTILYYPLATPTTIEITQENYPSLYNALKQIQDYLTAYKINKEFILGYSSPEIEY